MTERPILFNTAAESLPALGRWLGVDLMIKRDDYLPFPGGGNKVRKMAYIFQRMVPPGVDTLVTHGGMQSNHARVVALEASRRKFNCEIILHGDETPDSMTGNMLLMKLAGAVVHIASYDRMWDTVQDRLAQLTETGQTPFLIPGGGHCVEGACSYADAVAELQSQLPNDWVPDFIILASGTGTTQSGIMAGIERAQWRTAVIGVSVGRTTTKGKAVVEDSLQKLREYLGLKGDANNVLFRDDWLCGGYEKFTNDIVDVIRLAAQYDGLVLDPTYTGKAFAALIDLVRSGEIPQMSRVLFWHTGGLINLLSASRMLESSLQL